MKVIDLLNKIANREEVPKKIKYNDKIWRLASNRTYFIGSDYGYDFWVEHGDDKFEDEPITLNDEVEIIEEEKKSLNDIRESYGLPRIEEKKIPEKLEEFDIQGLEVSGYSMTQAEYLLEDGVKENRKMINWILDYLKSKGE